MINMILKLNVVLVFCLCFVVVYCNLKAPPGFKFGVATASYQIEGGWNANGKGENIWDRFTHTQKIKIKDHTSGDVACDSYHLWQEDIENLKFLGVDFYRFSISWTRILPTGFPNKINQDGVRYYHNLINQLIANNIEPMVTLYHWDLPQSIQDLGGWTNSAVSDYFADFARIAFSLFGDRVKIWITINEPYSFCVTTYEDNDGAPGIKSPGIGSYLCGKNVLLAHAKAFKIYQEQFKDTQNGKVGITIDSIWAEPKTSKPDDTAAAEREMQMSFGWYAHPIFSKSGNYPDIMITRVGEMSKSQNFTSSRLPPLSKKEIGLIKGSADFLGLNHYHTWLVSNKSISGNEVSFDADKATRLEKDPHWQDPTIVPFGFRKLLNWVREEYNNPLVYITENGIGDTSGTLHDDHRVTFLQEYITALFRAINEDGCNVARYTVWSLMDNMEWTLGYTVKYGLYNVNFKDSVRTRTPKYSAYFYKGLILKNKN